VLAQRHRTRRQVVRRDRRQLCRAERDRPGGEPLRLPGRRGADMGAYTRSGPNTASASVSTTSRSASSSAGNSPVVPETNTPSTPAPSSQR